MKLYKLLAVLVFFTLSCSYHQKKALSTVSKETSIAVTDSLMRDSLIKQHQFGFVSEEYGDTIGGIHWNIVDSILNEQKIDCCAAKTFYAPDSSFKIFVLKGESCGMNCNSFWDSFVYSKNNILLQSDNAFFAEVDSIYKISDNKYLIIQQWWSRHEHCRKATIVSLNENSLIFHSILNDIRVEKFLSDIESDFPDFTICQYHNIESEESKLDFNASTLELEYTFIPKKYNESSFKIKGTLKYENEKWILKKHQEISLEN